jgi:hypothetical protein
MFRTGFDRRRFFYALPALAFAGMIFYLSSLPHIDLPLEDISGSDKILHGLGYCFFGATLLFAACPTRMLRDQPLKVYAILLAIGMLYGLSDEIHQSFVVNRTCSLDDFFADTIGVALAMAGRHLLVRWRGEKERTAEYRTRNIES